MSERAEADPTTGDSPEVDLGPELSEDFLGAADDAPPAPPADPAEIMPATEAAPAARSRRGSRGTATRTANRPGGGETGG